MSGKPMANASEPPHSGFFQVFQLKTVFCTLVTSFAKPSSEPKFFSRCVDLLAPLQLHAEALVRAPRPAQPVPRPMDPAAAASTVDRCVRLDQPHDDSRPMLLHSRPPAETRLIPALI